MAAYDGYRKHSDSSQPPYSSSYDSSYDARSYQPSSNQQNQHYYESPDSRSRASSDAPSEGLSQSGVQPLRNALNNAFDKSETARAVDPDLIAHITAEVKKSVLDEIKKNGVDGGTGQPQPPPPHQASVPLSPASTSASIPSRNVYTPPSPRHHDYSSQGSASPDPLAHDPLFDGAGDTPTPRVDRSAPVPRERQSRSRPTTALRMPTDADYTPLERMWQFLFDEDDRPTPRLGQFLRGLAIHLIEDYEPKKSLVITPAKMLKFYGDVKLPDEIYPWQKIFGRLQYSTLAKIYRDMRCQHHMVQEHLSDQPHIPALTPQGFEEWMTVMIQAYPDTEYERLSRAVLDMPISNADDCKERFPKELPRRLFPHRENLHAQQRCAAALSAEGVGPLRKAPTFPPPPPMGSSGGPPPNLERERSPYNSRQDSRVLESEDEDATPLAIPIERERKPYTAAPGGGKIYDEGLSSSVKSDSSLHDHMRTQSSASSKQYAPPPSAPPYQTQHPRTNSGSTRRPRSPSFTKYGTRSDPSVRDIPGSYYSSNMYDSEEETRKQRNDWARRQAEEDATSGPSRRSTAGTDGSFESQPRSVYNDDYYRGRGNSNGYDNRGYEPRRY